MKIRLSRRILALAVAFVMVLGLLPTAAFARTAGKDGSAEMNEAYAAKETLMPVGPSFSTYTLLEWTPESDPDAIYSRASIPLAERVGGFVVNPLANPEAKLMLCSLANSDHDNTGTQGTESFLSYSFNYWQYVDSFVYWSGSEEGLVVCPTAEFIDAAHTNGVPVVATLGFPWGSGAGYVQEVNDFCQKAADGTFPVADKMIEVMDYYGFDGYFFNQESYGCSQATAERLDEMIHYMHAKRPDMLISWYDSMISTGSVSYGDAVNDYNKHWMAYDENGVVGVDQFFMNYNWTYAKVSSTITAMKSINRSQFDAFAGIDVQQNCMDTYFADHNLVDADGIARLSLALYCPNSTLGLSANGAQFHEVERTFYTNAKEDPRDTSVDVADSSVYEWAGMSRLFADKTPITTAPFVSDFNSGHGTGYYVDGVLSRDAEWSYQSNQDVMPTWTWIIDSTGSKLEGDYDFTDAWNGGNSIKFHGNLSAGKANDILIYSTKIGVESGMTLSLTAKGCLENASLVAYLGNGSESAYDECEQAVFALNEGEGWVETVADLSAHAGKTLYAIGLKVESAEAVSGYQINLGRITVLDKARNSLKGPSDITLDEIMYKDAYSAEARIYWSKVTGASSYEIYKVNADGSKTLIMETPSTAFYIPTLKRAADEENVTLEIVPVNRNGQRGTGTTMTIDWAYANGDTEEVLDLVFENVCLNAPVTGVSFENSGEPASKALDGTAANNSKWCATNYGSGWMSIDIGREVTVRRWRVEHAEYGGEANNMNTIDFALEYKADNGAWVQVKRIQNNHDAVTDVLLDTPVTAQEWRLYVYDDGSSPWGGIRIYEWQMFETDQFPQTAVVPMHFAAAVNGVGATDSFTLDKVPSGQTVKVYDAEGTLLGEAVSSGTTVTLTGLDFGTSDAGRVYYTTTSASAAESAKLSVAFEAEAAVKSAPATDVEFVKYSHPGSVSSSNGADIYTTLTVNGLAEGDVVYVLGDESKVSLPATGDSVSIDGVRVVRAGGSLTLQVKRVGQIISDPYTVTTPAFPEPTATIQVFAKNAAGETLTGVRFEVVNTSGESVAQMSTTSDSGAKAEVALGTYTIRNTESPDGYGLAGSITAIPRIEGWTTAYTVIVPTGSVEPTDPEPTDPEPTDPVTDPSDDSRDIPLDVLNVSAGDWQTGYESSEGPANLAVDNDPNTLWHTNWYGTSRADHWFQFELTEDYNVDGLRYWPRQSGNDNGTITSYEIQVSDDGVEFRTVATGNWANDREWKLASFGAEHVKYVRLVSVDAVTDNAYVFASASEIRLTGEVYVAPPAIDPTVNQALNAEIIAYNGTLLGNAASGPEKLFDGAYSNPDTDKWCEDGRNLWVAFDIGSELPFGELKLLHAGANNEWSPTPGATNTEGYEFYVFNDSMLPVEDLLGMDFATRTSVLQSDAYWTLIASRTGNKEDITIDELDVTGRIFKINISDTDSTGWADCVRLYELEMYANGSGTVVPEPTDPTDPVEPTDPTDPEPTDPEPTDPTDPTEPEEPGVQKILHLDNGRKLYSAAWIKALLNEMSAAGYTHLQLAFGNDGLRFVLDDMTIEANGTTYASDDVKAGIELGNKAYHDEGEKNALTESEMDEILAHAESVGIEIVPHLNMPGHMDALLDAIEYVGIDNAHFTGYVESVRSLNLNNDQAIAFTQALLDKYAAYFAEAGCSYFHIGADEFANDAYNGNMGFPSMGSALYTKFANFVNDNAAIVKDYGMTPRAWNDGISYTNYYDDFDTDIEITYWSSGWWGYNLASASSLRADGHGMINTHGDYYYILGVNDIFTEGTSTTHTPGIYEPAAGYDITSFMGGSTIADPVGGMFCIWADYPGAETETEVAANIRLILRAMALRMDGESLDGMDTSVVEGGFNVDGSINGSEVVEPADKSELATYIEYAEAMDAGDYTAESWAAVEEALERAYQVYADANATQAEVDEAAELLVSAILLLENVPTYYVMVAAMENGTVTVDKDEAREGELVTLTVTPDEGYSLVAGSLKANDAVIEGTSFTMPAEDVIITAEFVYIDDDAVEAAREAQAAAEAAQKAAEEAQRKAEEALAAAEEAAASAAEDKEAAEAAQREAAEAQAAAEAAQKAAEDAQAAAEAAAAAAEAHDVAAAEAAAEAAKHAQEVAELYEEIAAMKAEMAEYLKDAQKAAEEAEEHRKKAEAAELACAKYYALIRLAQYADTKDFDAVGQAELEAIVAEAIEAINAAETAAAVEEELAKALAAIDRIGQELPFTDVPADAFYRDAVKWALKNSITTGTSETTFSPGKTVSRAEAVTFLWRAKGCPEPATTENPFVDVKESDFFYKAVLWAVEMGITNGTDESHFAPYASANRAQIVTFLYRAEGTPDVSGENPFGDVSTGDYFYNAVLWAVENDITTGMTTTTFGASGICNRAQMVTFLYRAYA